MSHDDKLSRRGNPDNLAEIDRLYAIQAYSALRDHAESLEAERARLHKKVYGDGTSAVPSLAPTDIDRSYALSLADAVENCRVTCKHEPSAFDLEQQGYDTIIRALRAFATPPSPLGAPSEEACKAFGEIFSMKSEIDEIVLVGGSTRIPKVQ